MHKLRPSTKIPMLALTYLPVVDDGEKDAHEHVEVNDEEDDEEEGEPPLQGVIFINILTQVFCANLFWCSIYNSPTILITTLPAHSTRSWAQLLCCTLYIVRASKISVNLLTQKLFIEG